MSRAHDVRELLAAARAAWVEHADPHPFDPYAKARAMERLGLALDDFAHDDTNLDECPRHPECVREPKHSGRCFPPQFVELIEEHRREPFFKAFGGIWQKSSFIGRILPEDLGRRVYLRGGVLEVESREQRDARRAREAKP